MGIKILFVPLLIGLGNLLYKIIIIVFAFIVIYDTVGLKRSVGLHAKVLNKIMQGEEFSGFKNTNKLSERIGNKPKEVLSGILIGFIIGMIL